MVRRLNRADDDYGIAGALAEAITGEELRQFLQYLANPNNPENKPSGVAGEQRDFDQAVYIKALWDYVELDYVNVSRYNVLLSYPDPEHPNRVELLDGSDVVKFTTAPGYSPGSGAGGVHYHDDRYALIFFNRNSEVSNFTQ